MDKTAMNMLPLLVTAAVIHHQERILLTKRPDHKPQGGLWEFPGGKLHPGESPTVALRRELKEELNIEIRVEAIIDAVYHRYDWGPVLILAYRCSWLAGTIEHLEVADHRWLRPDELDSVQILAADRPIVAHLQTIPSPP